MLSPAFTIIFEIFEMRCFCFYCLKGNLNISAYHVIRIQSKTENWEQNSASVDIKSQHSKRAFTTAIIIFSARIDVKRPITIITTLLLFSVV